jgi:RNA polymerase sigma factor (sigma-70 family)
VKAYLALPRFRSDAPFRPWMLTIVANEARNRGRSTRRTAQLALRAAAVDGAEKSAPSPEAAVVRHDEQRTLLAAMERLREADRLVLGYRFFLGLSEAEIASALHCRRGTVKSRTSRALGRLRAELASSPSAAGLRLREAADG